MVLRTIRPLNFAANLRWENSSNSYPPAQQNPCACRIVEVTWKASLVGWPGTKQAAEANRRRDAKELSLDCNVFRARAVRRRTTIAGTGNAFELQAHHRRESRQGKLHGRRSNHDSSSQAHYDDRS